MQALLTPTREAKQTDFVIRTEIESLMGLLRGRLREYDQPVILHNESISIRFVMKPTVMIKISSRKCAPILNMVVEMKGNGFVDGRRKRGKCPCVVLGFVVSSNTRLHKVINAASTGAKR